MKRLKRNTVYILILLIFTFIFLSASCSEAGSEAGENEIEKLEVDEKPGPVIDLYPSDDEFINMNLWNRIFKKHKYSIIPKPVQYKTGEGLFHMDSSVSIYSDPVYETQASILQQFILADTNLNLNIEGSSDKDNLIKLLNDTGVTHPEGYILKISRDGIIISASTEKGIFYGIQTLRQIILRCPDMKLEAAAIEDYPRFEWRGLHLDVSRHFFPVSFLYKFLDTMAFYKFNRFHWHLTDDQGWRIEIKKYPELTKTGSYREQEDGSMYGGYYTREEIRQVVAYAEKLHIEVVPEIEMPGHAVAAIAAYPELSCRKVKLPIQAVWGVYLDVFCAGREGTFDFLENVLSEVIDLFPGKYIHIGGDECPKDRWRECPDCQERIKQEGLKDEFELQSYFIKRISSYLANKGKKVIGWDEIMEGGLAEEVTVMVWREDGVQATSAAVSLGNDVILTPRLVCYLDWKQSSTDNTGSFGVSTIGNIYDYNPIPKNLSEEEAGYIIGIQGNIWTEKMETGDMVEYMAFPRALAIAETGWSQNKYNWEDFTERVKVHLEILSGMGINSYKIIER